VIEHASGTRDFDRLGGLAHRMPRSSVITLSARWASRRCRR